MLMIILNSKINTLNEQTDTLIQAPKHRLNVLTLDTNWHHMHYKHTISLSLLKRAGSRLVVGFGFGPSDHRGLKNEKRVHGTYLALPVMIALVLATKLTLTALYFLC